MAVATRAPLTMSAAWRIRASLLWIAILIIGAITILPFVWMICTSLKLPSEALVPPTSLDRWIPRPFTAQNYTSLFTDSLLPFPAFFLNSLKIAFFVVIGRLFFASLAGYAFATMEFPGRDAAFALIMASMMVPGMVTIFPLYVMYAQIGWIDTHWPLIVPNAFGAFLMRQFFMTLPKELSEAAIVDGAGQFTIFSRIYLPLSGPVLATLAIFSFQGTWNDFFDALIFLNKTANFTLPLGLAFFNSSYGTQYTRLMAGSMISLVPILIVYAFAQQYFTRGISLSGIKG